MRAPGPAVVLAVAHTGNDSARAAPSPENGPQSQNTDPSSESRALSNEPLA